MIIIILNSKFEYKHFFGFFIQYNSTNNTYNNCNTNNPSIICKANYNKYQAILR